VKVYGKLRWRRSFGRYHYEDDKFGYGYANRNLVGDGWYAVTQYKGTDTRTLREAKAFIERTIRARLKKRKK
jgi:hypothetical protein